MKKTTAVIMMVLAAGAIGTGPWAKEAAPQSQALHDMLKHEVQQTASSMKLKFDPAEFEKVVKTQKISVEMMNYSLPGPEAGGSTKPKTTCAYSTDTCVLLCCTGRTCTGIYIEALCKPIAM
jgi:hypothetical protein